MACCGSASSLARLIEWIDSTGRVTHYRPGTGNRSLSKGNELNTILKDARGYLWLGGLGCRSRSVR